MKTHSIKVMLLLLIISPLVRGQQLGIDDIINMRKMSVEQIDSVMRSKDFVKTHQESDTSVSTVNYASLARTDTALIQRNFTVGIRKDNLIELTYKVYQQKDAALIITWLEKNGFKKNTSKMPDKNGNNLLQYTYYQKNRQSVGYEESEFNSIDKKEMVYTFYVNNIEFP